MLFSEKKFRNLDIFQDGDAISVTKAGKLRFAKPSKYWVEGSQKRVGVMLLVYLYIDLMHS